jgi:type II secretion system protein C
MNLRKIPLLANVLLVGLILWVGTSAFLTWKNDREKRQQPAAFDTDERNRQETVKGREKRLRDFRFLTDRNIFKTALKHGNQKQAGAQEEVKITQLDLKLKGTVLGDNHDNSFAIIQDGKKNEQELYYLRDFVHGAQIEKILSDRIILNLAGKQEVLIMSDEPDPAPGVVRRPSTTTRRTTPRRVVRRPTRKVIRRPVKPPVTREEDAEVEEPDAQEEDRDEEEPESREGKTSKEESESEDEA